jgi:SAM-dependent methyltransferase
MIGALVNAVMEVPLCYEAWSGLVNRPKVDAVLGLMTEAGADLGRVRLLDVGCGPGTNAEHFAPEGYLGVDINPDYVVKASGKHPHHRFMHSDAAGMNLADLCFDFILMNSFLHHVDDAAVVRVLGSVRDHLAAGGGVVIQEPLIPEAGNLPAHLLMRLDRGGYFRERGHWLRLFEQAGYRAEIDRAYSIRLFGMHGWSMMSAFLKPSA